MPIFKVLVLCGLFCLSYAWTTSDKNWNDESSLKELEESIALSSKEEQPKVNWAPICQQLQVNDLDSNSITSDSDVFYVPQEVPGVVISPVRGTTSNEDVCEVPNGLGLKNLLKQAKKILPYERLKSIIFEAADNIEIKRVKDLLATENFRAQINGLTDSPHFLVLRDYVCRALNLNVKYYVDFVRNLIAAEKSKEPLQPLEHGKGRPGINGLITDLTDALPKQELRDLYVNLLVSDEYLVAATRRIKSSEFRQLLKNLSMVGEFQEMKKMLIDVGVPLERVKKFIDTALGWQGNELEIQNF